MAVFSPAKSIGQFVQFDDQSRQLKILRTEELVSYDDITGFELAEEVKQTCGLAKAYSLSFTGAKQMTALDIKLTLTGGQTAIRLLITPAKDDSMIYQKLLGSAREILAELERICPGKGSVSAEGDYTDELRRLKALCDEGVISPEEFAAKKQHLLGI